MNKKLTNALILIIPFVFYIVFFFIDGYVMCDDSESYIMMNEMREPLYPLIIDLFRKILGETNNLYLYGVVLFQSLLMAYVTYNVVSYFKKEYVLNNIFTYLILIILLSISLLCRFAAKRGSMYTSSILSEGVAYPLFILFFRYNLEYLIHYGNKSLIIATLLSFVLVSIRKQMYLTLILLIISIIYVFIKTKDIKKGIIKLLIVILIVFGGFKLFDLTYMKLVHETNGTHTSDNRFMTTMVFYVSEKEDAELIEDEVVRELFLDTYNECEKNGHLKHSADDGWYKRVLHFGDNYDYIQDLFWNVFRTYAWGHGGENIEQFVDYCNEEVTNSLMPKVWPKIFVTFIDNVLAGLMITVSADKEILLIPSIIIYIIYIILLILNIKKNKLDKYSILGLITLISVILNVLIVSLVIFNQTRYTIYNMPMFYIAMLVMLYNVFVNKKKEIK